MPAAIDSNILIYILDDASPFSVAARSLLEQLENQSGAVYVSTVTRTEVLHMPYMISWSMGQQAQRFLDGFNFLTYVAVSTEVADIAAQLTTQAGAKLKNMDSIHLASALHSGATEFWTNDRILAKVSIKGLSIRLLSDLS